MACSYCGYAGQDAEEHKRIHGLLDELIKFDMPEARFRALWAQVAIKLGWPFT